MRALTWPQGLGYGCTYTPRLGTVPAAAGAERSKEGSMHGYCMKCREKRELKDAQVVTLKNGRAATQGTCSVCGTKVTVMGAGKAAKA